MRFIRQCSTEKCIRPRKQGGLLQIPNLSHIPLYLFDYLRQLFDTFLSNSIPLSNSPKSKFVICQRNVGQTCVDSLPNFANVFLLFYISLCIFHTFHVFYARSFNEVGKTGKRRTKIEKWKHPSTTVREGKSHRLALSALGVAHYRYPPWPAPPPAGRVKRSNGIWCKTNTCWTDVKKLNRIGNFIILFKVKPRSRLDRCPF